MISLVEGVFPSLEILYFYIVMISEFKFNLVFKVKNNFSDVCNVFSYTICLWSVSLCCFVIRHHQSVFLGNDIITVKRHSLKKKKPLLSQERIFSALKQYLPI